MFSSCTAGAFTKFIQEQDAEFLCPFSLEELKFKTSFKCDSVRGTHSVTGAPNGCHFLSNALKRCSKLSGVLLILCRLLLGCTITYFSVHSVRSY